MFQVYTGISFAALMQNTQVHYSFGFAYLVLLDFLSSTDSDDDV